MGDTKPGSWQHFLLYPSHKIAPREEFITRFIEKCSTIIIVLSGGKNERTA